MVLGNILTLGYKTTLLSSLITINYENPIDNIYDLDKSGLPLIMAKGVSVVEYIRHAPGAMMDRIFKRRILFTISKGGSAPSWLFEKYVNKQSLPNSNEIDAIKLYIELQDFKWNCSCSCSR